MTSELEKLVARYRAQVEQERQAESSMILEVTRSKGSMPSNYWVPRYKAEQHLWAAERMLEAYKEEAQDALSEQAVLGQAVPEHGL